jgi:hypothetical protein
MEYNKIIIALLIVIVALLVVGIMIFGPFSKESANLSVTTNNILYDGDNFGISLIGNDGKPIANAKVDIKIIDDKGVENNQAVTTDEKGEGLLQLKGLTPGNYLFNVTYNGDDNYNGNSTSQNIEFKETKTVETSSQSSSGGSGLPYDINNLPPSNDPNPETKRFYIDQYHVRQEYSDHYYSIVDLRTGERHGAFF